MARRLSSPMVVGRDDELNRLRAVVARGSAGETEAVVVSGEAGVGKTRLVEELARVAESSGMLVATGGCSALADAPLPYGPVVAVVDALVGEVDDSELERLLGDAGPDLARIDPALTDRLANAVPVPMPASMIAARVFSAVRTLIERRARDRALLVVFEDLHWADPASLDLIGYLIRNRGWPGAIVATYRSDELHRRHPLVPWLAEIARVPFVERIELRRLDRSDVEAQVGAILGRTPDAALVDELVRRADGNAFFTEELLAAVQSDGTIPRATGVQQLLLARIASLPDLARSTVEAMSVAGSPGDAVVLARVLGIPERDVEDSMRAALDAQVLMRADDGRGPVFRHALTQEAVYDSLLPTERRRHHLAFARELEAAAEPGKPVRLAEIVHHSLAANDLPRAFRASIGAGDAASAAGAFIDAAQHLDRAVQLVDVVPDASETVDGGRSGLLRLAAEATRYAGNPARAVGLWEAAIAALPSDARPQDRATLLLGLAVDANETFANDLALASTQEANELLADQVPSRLRALAFADLARDLYTMNRPDEASAANERAIEMAAKVGDRRVEALARGRLELDRFQQDGLDEAWGQMEIALAIARETRDRDVVSSVYMNAGWLLERAGEAGRAADLLVSEAIPIARELGLSTLAMAAWGAFYLWLAGRWDEGRRVLDEAAHDDRVRSGRSNSLQVAGALYDATMGRFDPAQAALDQLRLDDHGDPAPHVIAAELSLWRGDPTAAIVAATSALALGPLMIERGDRTFRGWVLRLIARAEADRAVGPGHRRADDDRRAAAARADAAAAQCRELVVAGDPYDRFGGDLPANLAQTEAEATRASGHSDPVAWASAADAWDQIARPFEAAYSRYRRAEALLAEHGRRAEAADDLRHAAAVATGLGAAPLLREIESLATRSRIGLDARMAPAGAASDAGAPAPALTRREMEVLALLAEGRTNRQIADALFISESTAGVHVSNILGKLAVTGRTEAAAVAYRSGLVPTGRTDPG